MVFFDREHLQWDHIPDLISIFWNGVSRSLMSFELRWINSWWKTWVNWKLEDIDLVCGASYCLLLRFAGGLYAMNRRLVPGLCSTPSQGEVGCSMWSFGFGCWGVSVLFDSPGASLWLGCLTEEVPILRAYPIFKAKDRWSDSLNRLWYGALNNAELLCPCLSPILPE